MFAATTLFAQVDENAIRKWQSLHPTTLLISAERYNSLSTEEQQLLGTDVIVFQEKITLSQLEQYDAEKSISVGPKETAAKDEDLRIIKEWRGKHRDVQLIPHSKYVTLTEVRLQQVHSAGYIVLEGEEITVKDIDAYTTLYGE
jgi:hypothetical protein